MSAAPAATNLLALLGDEDDGLSPHARKIYQILDGSDPAAVLTWLRTTTARQILGEIAHTAEPLTHTDLDRYPPGNVEIEQAPRPPGVTTRRAVP